MTVNDSATLHCGGIHPQRTAITFVDQLLRLDHLDVRRTRYQTGKHAKHNKQGKVKPALPQVWLNPFF